jgi:Luciferase-like monooxygenase
MQFGYFTLSDNHYDDNIRAANDFIADIIDEAIYAEEVGLHSAWIGEHHFSTPGVLSCPDLVLANVAARTRNIRLAPAVTVLPLHHPIRVAEQWATLDMLSGGRVDFAAGRGYDRREFLPLNVSFEDNLRGGNGGRSPPSGRATAQSRTTASIAGSTMSRSPRNRCNGHCPPMSPRSRNPRSNSQAGSASASSWHPLPQR